MHSQTRFTYQLLYLMLLLPILSYLNWVLLGRLDTLYIFRIFSIIYDIFFIFSNKVTIKIPKAAYFLLVFSIYQYIWSFFNHDFIGRSFNLSVLIGNEHFAMFFMLIIIYNTKFNDSFIKKTILIFKITILLAFVASIIQLINVNFLNASGYWASITDL